MSVRDSTLIVPVCMCMCSCAWSAAATFACANVLLWHWLHLRLRTCPCPVRMCVCTCPCVHTHPSTACYVFAHLCICVRTLCLCMSTCTVCASVHAVVFVLCVCVGMFAMPQVALQRSATADCIPVGLEGIAFGLVWSASLVLAPVFPAILEYQLNVVAAAGGLGRNPGASWAITSLFFYPLFLHGISFFF